MLWTFKAVNDVTGLSLHDCRVTQMRTQANNLVLDFANGFWITAQNQHNPYGETLRTDASQVRIIGFDIEEIYIFCTVSLCGRHIATLRKSLPLNRLQAQINSGRWRLELIDSFYGGGRLLWNAYILSGNETSSQECQLMLGYRDMECGWNRICRDKRW